MNFEQKVKLIENASVQVVKEGMPYVKTIVVYGGELGSLNTAQGRENLKDLLKRGGVNFPAVMVAYNGGVPELIQPIKPDAAQDVRHRFTLVFVACDNNSRGMEEQRLGIETENPAGSSGGTHKMVSDLFDLFIARQFITRIGAEDVILNEGELIPLQDGYIERVPNVTAHAVLFNGSFSFMTSARSSNVPIEIEQINLGVGIENPNIASPGGKPGVQFE